MFLTTVMMTYRKFRLECLKRCLSINYSFSFQKRLVLTAGKHTENVVFNTRIKNAVIRFYYLMINSINKNDNIIDRYSAASKHLLGVGYMRSSVYNIDL